MMNIQQIIHSYQLHYLYSILICNENNYEHSENNPLILVTILVFHFDISGNDFNDEHSANKNLILVTLFVFHFDI